MAPWICRIPFLKSSHYQPKFPIFAHNNNNNISSLLSFSTSSAPKISTFDYLVNHHQFSPECAANVSSSLSSSTKYLNNPQNADSVLNFLKDIGFDKNQIQTVVRKLPTILSAKLEKSVKPKVEVFQDLGFHSSDFAHIISTCPWLLNSSSDRLRLSILALKNVLGANADICSSFLKKYGSGRSLMDDWERTFLPNMEYLKSCGICSLQIASYVCRYPFFFLTKPARFMGLVRRADEMGVNRKCKMFIEAVRVMSSFTKESWELKLDLFRELGFSQQNILVAFRRAPQSFGASESKIKQVIQLLLSVEDISYISSNPVLLTYSVEKRLKPRLRVLNALQSKNLLNRRLALAQFLAISDARFIDKYVSPYSNEVEGLYAVFQGS